MIVARDAAAFRAAVAGLPRPLGFVPTMGALHAGHLALAAASRAATAATVASIFVNPLQFGPGEDFDRYPRAFPSDVAALEAAGVAVLFAPAADEMYPAGFATTVDPGPLSSVYEGALRPGHFAGVATVCTKLFSLAGAERAFFGAKDAQQIAVLRRIIADLSLPVELAIVPTVREPDGLALSSRNAYLDAAQRAAAPRLFRALRRLAEGCERGLARDAVLAQARGELQPPLREAYLDVVDPATFAPVWSAPALAIGSVWCGATRLLDNVAVGVAA